MAKSMVLVLQQPSLWKSQAACHYQWQAIHPLTQKQMNFIYCKESEGSGIKDSNLPLQIHLKTGPPKEQSLKTGPRKEQHLKTGPRTGPR